MGAVVESMIAATRSLHDIGVPLLAGTDATPGGPSSFGISMHREFELLAQAGLTPLEILAGATGNTAAAFRLGDRGRILVGRRADMLLVRGDPTASIDALRDIVHVWKAGVEVDRTTAN
jgi:imidazolonepropionase-like amidohydrolase